MALGDLASHGCHRAGLNLACLLLDLAQQGGRVLSLAGGQGEPLVGDDVIVLLLVLI